MSGSAPNFPLQKSLSRRVSFNEASIRRRYDSDTEAQSEGRLCGPQCRPCCFWVSIALALLLFLLIFVGSLYYAYLRSNLPNVRLQRLDVFKIDVNSTNSETLLTADIVVYLNATNQNGKAELVYSSMWATMSSIGIDFGKFKMADVIQPPLTSTAMMVPAYVNNRPVEDAEAEELQYIAGKRLLVIDVHVRGKIGVYVTGNRVISFPFKIECTGIDQSEIEAGRPPRCSAELNSLG